MHLNFILLFVLTFYVAAYEEVFNGTADTSTASTCVTYGKLCGNHGLGLDPNNLYQCGTYGSAPLLYQDCSFTCCIFPTVNDGTGNDAW